MPRGAPGTGPNPTDIAVGRKVCERRIALGYNQSDLGRALGLTFQQVQKYEKGTNRISASKLWDIARFLKVDVTYFFDGLPDAPHVDPAATAAAPSFPLTRSAVEITLLARQLSSPQQKLTLEMMQMLFQARGDSV